MHDFDKLTMSLRDYSKPEFRTTDARVRKLSRAMNHPLDAISQVLDYKNLVADDDTSTRSMQKVRVKKYAERISSQAKHHLTTAQIEAVKEIDSISKRISEAFKIGDAATEQRKTAILEDLAALPRVQRDQKIRQALMNNHREIIEALATRPHSPRYSILYVHNEAKEALARLTVGNDLDVLHDLQDGLKAVENATHKLDRYVQDNFITPAMIDESKAEAVRNAFNVDYKPTLEEELNNE